MKMFLALPNKTLSKAWVSERIGPYLPKNSGRRSLLMWTVNYTPGKFGNWVEATQCTKRDSGKISLSTVCIRGTLKVSWKSSHVYALLARHNSSDSESFNKIASVVKAAEKFSAVTCLGDSRFGRSATRVRRLCDFTAQLMIMSVANLKLPASNGILDDVPDRLVKTRANCLGENCEESRSYGGSMPAEAGAECAGRVDGQHASLSRCVAVIGAGAGGLVAARELLREGHDVVIFEQSEEVGGVWVYDPKVESDLLGVDPHRSRVFSSIYKSLRTNLPREIMGFTDYPFVHRPGKGRDARRFPSHAEVLRYLEDFAHDYNLNRLVEFGVKVEHVSPQWGEGLNGIRWIVKVRRKNSSQTLDNGDTPSTVGDGPSQVEIETRVFDAVVVCNGHFAEARIAHIPGVESWPGVQVHSHNYRGPEPFQDKVVVVIGCASSGTDISQEVGDSAREVHLCSRSWTASDSSTEWEGPRRNMWRHPMVRRARADGAVEFQDGSSVVADFVIHCTGYLYDFPFLDVENNISIDDNRVDPLYKHVFPPALAPSLSIVGMNFKVIPFICMEVQARWIAKLLSGKLSLPTKDEMVEDVRKWYEKMDGQNIPRNQTHSLSSYQRTYIDWVVEQEGGPPVGDWRFDMYDSTAKLRKTDAHTYRDTWYEQELVNRALASFETHKISAG